MVQLLDYRGLRYGLDAGAVAQADLPQLCPGSIVLDLLQEVVDKCYAVGIQRKSDTVVVLRSEGVACDLINTRVLYDGVQKQCVVSYVCVYTTLLQSGTRFLVVGKLLNGSFRRVLSQDVRARGTGLCRYNLASQVVYASDIRIACLYQDCLLGCVVRSGERNDFLTCVCDGVGSKYSVYLIACQNGLTGTGIYLCQLILALIAQDVACKQLIQSCIKAADAVVCLIQLAEL